MVTLSSPASATIKVKRSEFIAHLTALQSADEMEALVKRLKKSYPKARHVCWAYRIFQHEAVVEYSSDAGEPAGTAGRPILNQLRSHDAVNTGCAVVRHFGGIKLGKRGLIEAYGDAAAQGIQAGRWAAYVPQCVLSIRGPYALYGDLTHLVTGFEGRITEDRSQNDLDWKVSLPLKSQTDFLTRLKEFQSVSFKKIEQA